MDIKKVHFSKGMPKRIQTALRKQGTEMTLEQIQDLADSQLFTAGRIFGGKNANGWVAAICSHKQGVFVGSRRERELILKIAQLSMEVEELTQRIEGRRLRVRFRAWVKRMHVRWRAFRRHRRERVAGYGRIQFSFFRNPHGYGRTDRGTIPALASVRDVVTRFFK